MRAWTLAFGSAASGVEKSQHRESFSPPGLLELKQQLSVMSGLRDLPDEIIVTKLAVMTAIGAISVEAVADQGEAGVEEGSRESLSGKGLRKLQSR